MPRWTPDGKIQAPTSAALDEMQSAWRNPETRRIVRERQHEACEGSVCWADLMFGLDGQQRAPDMRAVDQQYAAAWRAAVAKHQARIRQAYHTRKATQR
jgi:hypothetical protein